MSRVANKPIEVPADVDIKVVGAMVNLSGPKGKLSIAIPSCLKLEHKVDTKQLVVDASGGDALGGTFRANLNNAVTGVGKGFLQDLELVGVGYKAEVVAGGLNLGLGYSHEIFFAVPAGVSADVVKDGRQIFVRIEGCDRQQVGQVAANIQRLRYPEPYKGKGVKLRGQVIKLKAGKSGRK